MRIFILAVLFAACATRVEMGGADGDGDDGSGDGTGDDGDPRPTSASPATAVNAGGIYIPFIGDVADKQLAFAITSTTVTAYGIECATSTCTPKWTYTLPANTIARGLGDIDDDGYPEVMMLTTSSTSTTCGNGQTATGRTLFVIAGANTQLLYQSSAIPDACVSVNGAPSAPYQAMHFGAVTAGGGTVLAISPQYYPTAWLVAPTIATHLYTAETSAYALYGAARPMLQPFAQGASYARDQQPFNGIVVAGGAGHRYVAATSGRFAQFAVANYGAQQLLVDSPFLARTDLVGRTYGLLQQDVIGNPDNLFLISGTWSADLLDDVLKGNASNVVTGSDLHASLERHITRLHVAAGDVSQRFVSYSGDDNNGNTYVGRITYPSRALLPSQNPAGSRVVYNQFDGSTWSIHISSPGAVESATIVANHYVWDTYQVDADTVELLISPVDTARTVQVPAYLSANGTVGSWRPATYFPKQETRVWRWTRSSEFASEVAILSGVPDLTLVAPTQNPTTSLGYLRRALVVDDGGTKKLVMRELSGAQFLAPRTW
jgi:hypothetical protein